jgi:hypothetical protein
MMDLMEGSHSIRTPEHEAGEVSYKLSMLWIDGKLCEMYTSDGAGHAGQRVVDSDSTDRESKQGCAKN